MATYKIYKTLTQEWEYADPRVVYNVAYHHTVEWTTANQYQMDECVVLYRDDVAVDVLFVGDIQLSNVVKTVIARSPLNDTKTGKFNMNVPPLYVGAKTGWECMQSILTNVFYLQRSPVDGARFTADWTGIADFSLDMNKGDINTSSQFATRYPSNSDPTPFPPEQAGGEVFIDGRYKWAESVSSTHAETFQPTLDWAGANGQYSGGDIETTPTGELVFPWSISGGLGTQTENKQIWTDQVPDQNPPYPPPPFTYFQSGYVYKEKIPPMPDMPVADPNTVSPVSGTDMYWQGTTQIWQYSSNYEMNSLYKKMQSYGQYLVVDYVDWDMPYNTRNATRPVPVVHYKVSSTTNFIGDLDVVSYQIAPNTSPIVGTSIKQQLRALITGDVTAQNWWASPESANVTADNSFLNIQSDSINYEWIDASRFVPYNFNDIMSVYGLPYYIYQDSNYQGWIQNPTNWQLNAQINRRTMNWQRDTTWQWDGNEYKQNYYVTRDSAFGGGGSIWTLYPTSTNHPVAGAGDVAWAVQADYDYNPYTESGLSNMYQINADQISFGKMQMIYANDHEIWQMYEGSNSPVSDVVDGMPAPQNIADTFWYTLTTMQTNAVFMLDHSNIDYVGNYVQIKGQIYEITEQYGNLIASSDYTIAHFK